MVVSGAKNGSSVYGVKLAGVSMFRVGADLYRRENEKMQESEAGATVHASVSQFLGMYVSFHRAVASPMLQSSSNFRFSGAQVLGDRRQWAVRC